MGPIGLLSILLVEDNPGDARLIEVYLGNGNKDRFRLETVSRLSEALDALERENPDVVLLDLGLPDSQGLETVERMTAGCNGTPVIVLTGRDDDELALQAIQRGAQDYLSKGGFDEELLVRTIRYAVERALSEESVRASEERYRNLFEQANEAVHVVLDGRIHRANPKSSELFGWDVEELLGKPFIELVHPDDREFVMDRHQRRKRGEDVPTHYEYRAVAKDGRTLWIEVSTGRVDWDGELAGLSLLTDITERKRAQARTEALLDRQTAMNELTLALGAATDAETLSRILYEHIRRLTAVDALFISRFDSLQDAILPAFAVVSGREQDVKGLPSLPLAPEGRGYQSTVIRTGKPHVVGDYREEKPRNATIFNVEEDGHVVRIDEDESLDQFEIRSAVLVPMKSRGEVTGVLQVQSCQPHAFGQADADLLAGLANVAAIALRNAQLVEESVSQATQLRAAFDGIVQTVSAAVETRDPYTAGHQRRVAELGAAIAETLGLDATLIEGVRVAGLVHDIGKLGIPAEILSKPGRLTDTEFDIIRAHPENAYHILESIDFPWPIDEAVYQHHERVDGSGYPRGLKGDDVTLEARILGVADIVEAMASHRPYRPALGLDAALEEIEAQKGTRLDPQIVEACVALFRERGFSFSDAGMMAGAAR